MFSNFTWLLLLFIAILSPLIFSWFTKDRYIDIPETIISMIVMALCVTSCFYVGKNFKISDNQIISGEIIDKVREHGSHLETYSCNCTDGKCDSCTRTIYTVDWYAVANIAKINIASDSSESSFIYNRKDPDRYKNIIIGEPASITRTFKNYIAATPDSVFSNRTIDPIYSKIMPKYPGEIYDFYRINRVLTIGKTSIDTNKWNDKLANHMKKWGYNNKSNVIFIFTDIANRGFTESLKNHWLQGKQNDIVIVFGLNGNSIVWSNVFSWTENERFKLELIDSLSKIESIQDDELIFQTIDDHIKNFKYRDMGTDFEYLDHMIAPHDLWIPAAYFLSILMSLLAITAKRKYLT